MRKLLGNSCTNGCFIYLVALVAIMVVTTFGLGGLKGKFAPNVIAPEPSVNDLGRGGGSGQVIITTEGSEVPAGGITGGGTILTPEPAPTFQPLPTIALPPTQPPASGQPVPPVQLTPVMSGQAGIVGQASAPFHIVRPGDTLWDVAVRFGVDTDTLRAVNNVVGNVIFPGQVLYLPQAPPAQPQPLPTVDPNAGAPEQPTPIIPQMPNTGIVNRP